MFKRLWEFGTPKYSLGFLISKTISITLNKHSQTSTTFFPTFDVRPVLVLPLCKKRLKVDMA